MRSHPGTTRRGGAATFTLLAALALAAIPSGCSSGTARSAAGSPLSGASVSGFDGAALPPGAPVHDFTLTDQAGRRVSLAQTRGQVTMLAFLDSTCGATCIVIAQQIRGALDELEHPPPVLLVSVDPAADTPAHVRRFLARVALSGRVRYLTAAPRTLRAVWHAFRIVPASAGRAAFERSASVLLLDRSGRERVIFQLGELTPEALSHDIRELL